MSELEAGTATAEFVIDASGVDAQLRAIFAQIGTIVAKQEKQLAQSTGFDALAKSIDQFAKATAVAEKQIRELKFDAIADEVNNLVSAFKGAESGVQITEDLARAEALLEERFATVRAEIEKQAQSQRGLVDEETLLTRTTLQLEAAQRQHDQALATVRGRAIQAAEGINQLETAELESALAANKAWESVGQLAIEQQKAEQSARDLAAQEAKLAADTERSAAMARASKEAWSGAQIAFGLVSKAVVGVTTALVAAEAAAVALTVKTVEQGDELNRLSDQYGVAVETLAGMKQAFKDNELEAGDLNTALRQFSNVLGEAMAGGEKATATVEALGISTEKLKDGTLSTEDAFRIAIDSLSRMENGYGKAAISQDLFGRAGSKIPGIFKDGAKSIDAASASALAMGNSFTKVEQQAVAKLDDAMDELSNRVAGLGASIGKELMPVAADIVEQANAWIEANRTLITQDVKGFANGIRDAMASLLPIIKAVTSGLRTVGEIVAGFSGPLKGSFASLTAEEARLTAEMEKAATVFRVMHPLTEQLGDSTDYIGNRYKALQAELAVVRARMEAVKDPTLQAAASMADLGRVTEEDVDAALDAADANDRLPPPIIRTGEAAKDTSTALKEAAQNVVDLRDESRKLTTVILKTGQSIEVTDEQLAAINRGLKASEEGTADAQTAWLRYIPTVEDAGAATEGATEEIGDVGRESVIVEGMISDLGQSFADLATGAGDLGDVLNSVLGNALDGLGREIGDMVKGSGIGADLASALGIDIGAGLANGIASAGVSTILQLGASIFAKGVGDIVAGETEKGLLEAGAAFAPMTFGTSLIPGLIASLAGAEPSMRTRISQFVERAITKALNEDTDYRAALEKGLAPLGFALTPAIAKTLTNASRQNDLLRATARDLAERYGEDFMAGFSPAFIESINKHGAASTSVPVSDWILAFFPDADETSRIYAQQLAKGLAAAEVQAMGLTGADAVTTAEQIAAGYVNLAQSQGMSVDEFIQWLQVTAETKGVSTQFIAALDQMNAALVEQGVNIDTVDAALSKAFGVKIDAGNLVDAFIQSGQSADVFVAQLNRIAQSDPGLKKIIDSLDPPLVDALHAVEDGGNAAAKAIGKLTGQANTSLAGVEARIYAFGEALYTVAEDGSKQLSTLGEELNSELVAGISGIEDIIKEEVNSAAGLTSETLGNAFAELKALAALPAEALDASTTEAIEHLKAVIQAATGWTAEQIDTMIATAADVPVPVAAVPPETTASLDGAADATGQIADNSQAAATAADDLTASTQATGAAATDTAAAFESLATRALTALDGLIGTVDDDAGLLSLEDLIERRIPEALLVAQEATLGATGVIHDSFDYARGSVLMLIDSILAIPTDVTTTHHLVTVNEGGGPPPEGQEPPKSHTGELIPGTPGQESLRIVEAGEWIWPADLTDKLLSGSALALPASMASRVSRAGAVQGVRAPTASAASLAGSGGPGLSSEWTALPVRKRDLIEGAVLEVARATEIGRARIEGRRFRVSPTYGRRR